MIFQNTKMLGSRKNNAIFGAHCLVDTDCAKYVLCQGKMGCRCQEWGECDVVRVVGQPCKTNLQCASGLLCDSTTKHNKGRCMPQQRYEDLPRFADLPDPNLASPPDIPATYGGPLLVGLISLFLVLLCLMLAAWYRLTSHTLPAREESPSVLISMNQVPKLTCYSTMHKTYFTTSAGE